jgi:hypothetical protein
MQRVGEYEWIANVRVMDVDKLGATPRTFDVAVTMVGRGDAIGVNYIRFRVIRSDMQRVSNDSGAATRFAGLNVYWLNNAITERINSHVQATIETYTRELESSCESLYEQPLENCAEQMLQIVRSPYGRTLSQFSHRLAGLYNVDAEDFDQEVLDRSFNLAQAVALSEKKETVGVVALGAGDGSAGLAGLVRVDVRSDGSFQLAEVIPPSVMDMLRQEGVVNDIEQMIAKGNLPTYPIAVGGK